MDKLRFLIETYYDYQKARIAFSNRLKRIPKEVRKLIENSTFFKQLVKDIMNFEKRVAKEIKQEVSKDKMYTEILSKIKGIGPILGGNIIARFCRKRDFVMANSHPHFKEIMKNPHAKIEKINDKLSRIILPAVLDIAVYPSDFYQYCGIIPGSKRERGKTIKYNPKAKDLFWKIMTQIKKNGKSYYCVLYELTKPIFLEKYKGEKGYRDKAHKTTLKKLARHLALTIYLFYKYINNQPAYLPYPVELLGHEVEYPFVDSPEGPKKLEFLIEYAKKFKRESQGDFKNHKKDTKKKNLNA
jgi:hypothetical protein